MGEPQFWKLVSQMRLNLPPELIASVKHHWALKHAENEEEEEEDDDKDKNGLVDWGDFLLDAGELIRDEYVRRSNNFPAKDEWCKLHDVEDRSYYYNKRTLESQWEPQG